MEQEDRKKKLAAGKEKLAAFRKKRARKNKNENENQDSSLNNASATNSSCLADNSSVSDQNSITGESDQYSLTSGDEWSAEESELQAAVHYRNKLAAATQRIADLEETVEGKQLALDTMVLEMQLSDPSSSKSADSLREDMTNSIKGSMPELEDAILQRDKIIRQLTARLQETLTSQHKKEAFLDTPDYLQETQHLSQQVVLLQQQLVQAGETVEKQMTVCHMSVQSLQEAKVQILALQGKVAEKNSLVEQLMHAVSSKTSELSALKEREAELETMVQKVLNERSFESGVQHDNSRLVFLEQELEKLSTDHALSVRTVDELQRQLTLSETTCQALLVEKEEAVEKIIVLEEKLNQLGQIRDAALQKMSDLERQVYEGSALIQVESDEQCEASGKVTQPRREIAELTDNDILQGKTAVTELSFFERSDLKNIISTQQSEIDRLQKHLESTELELAVSRDQVASLHEQLEQVQNRYKNVQEEAAVASHNFQQELQTAREANSHYQQQVVLAQEQVCAFIDSLQTMSSVIANTLSPESDFSVACAFNVDELESKDLTSQIQLLHNSYTRLYTQCSQIVEINHHLRSEIQTAVINGEDKDATIQCLRTEISHLQTVLDQKTSLVHKNDTDVDDLSGQLQAVIKQKEDLEFQVKEQTELTEQQILESDMMQRKMESRISSLFSEVTECKKALKESETANMELHEKLDAKSLEAGSLRLQLAASEDLMKELQNKADKTRSQLQQTEADLQVTMEDKQTQSQLEAHLEEKDLQLQTAWKEKDDLAEEAKIKYVHYEESLKEVQILLAEALQQHEAAKMEQERLVGVHEEEMLKLEENLKLKSEELEGLLSEQEQAKALLLSVEEKHAQRIQELSVELGGKSLELLEIVTEKEQLLSDLASEKADRDTEIKSIQDQLNEKENEVTRLLSDLESVKAEGDMEIKSIRDQLNEKENEVTRLLFDLESVKAEGDIEIKIIQDQFIEKETEVTRLLSDLESVKADRDMKIKSIQDQFNDKENEVTRLLSDLESVETNKGIESEMQLQDNSRETESVIAEKDQLIAALNAAEDNSRETESVIAEKDQLIAALNAAEVGKSQELQDLRQKLGEKSEECLTLLTEREDLATQLSDQQSSASNEVMQLQDILLQKSQESELLLAENKLLQEELLSCSSGHARDCQHLKMDLQQQVQRFEILLSDWNSLETDLHSRESAFSWKLKQTQQIYDETLKELKYARDQLALVTDASLSKDDITKQLNFEIKDLKEQMILTKATAEKALEDRKLELDALQIHVHQMEEELATSKQENDALLSRLAAQADMFKVKEEEMVAENNALNHQLEEVRNDAQETVSQLQKQQDDLQEELKAATASLQSLKMELEKARDESSQQNETEVSLHTSNATLIEEKEELTIRINSLKTDLEKTRKESDSHIAALQAEIDQLHQQQDSQLSELKKEIMHVLESNSTLQTQLDSYASEIEHLQQSFRDGVNEQEKLKLEKDKLQQQQETVQLDFSAQLEHAQAQAAAKDSELGSLRAQMRDCSVQLKEQIETLKEELAVAQAEITEKESTLISSVEELTTIKAQLEHVVEEKEMLKNNFDCCMEDMTQRANESDDIIRQMQGRLLEASQNVDRDQGQLREMYESQLSELEDRLAADNLEVQRLEKMVENSNAEKEKLTEKLNSQITELELTIQATESETAHLKEQITKMTEAHEKEIGDLKQSNEVHIASMEENCQSLEKALAKQDAVISDISSKFERERIEREKVYDQQLSEAYEQARLQELDVARAKRQLDEMKKDHQKEQQNLQKSLETQIFDLENKCIITTNELERMRKSIWSMERDHSGETQSLQNRIQELEARVHSQEKHISHLEDKLISSSEQLDEHVGSLRESYQSDVAHFDELNERLNGDVEDLHQKVKTMRNTHWQEMEALKREHSQELSDLREKCKQAEIYSHVLQTHLSGDSLSANSSELILKAEVERLQLELMASEANVAHLKQKFKEAEMSHDVQAVDHKDELSSFTLDNYSTDSCAKNLYQDLLIEKQTVQESHSTEHDLEEKSERFTAKNNSLCDHSSHQLINKSTEGRFVSVEEDAMADKVNHGNMDLQFSQVASIGTCTDANGVLLQDTSGFVTEDGFEPEPDSLEYLDLAVDVKTCENYFVEESELSKSFPRVRTKSVPSESFFAVEDEPACAAVCIEDLQLQNLSSGHRAVPTQNTDPVADSFQSESHLSFLPHPVSTLPQTHAEGKSVESCTQTSEVDLIDTLHQLQLAEGSSGGQFLDKNSPGFSEAVEHELSQRLESLQEQLEEEWVQKMRHQEVDLRLSYDLKYQEYQHQTEHHYQQQIQRVQQDFQTSFANEVRKMRKREAKRNLEKRKQREDRALKGKLSTGSGKNSPVVEDDTSDENLGDVVNQLHKDNQELAEVGDVLLEQIAMSQTQGRRHTMQHELQALVSGGSRLPPSHSFSLVPVVDTDQAPTSSQSTAADENIVQQSETESLVASQKTALDSAGFSSSNTATATQEFDDELISQSTPVGGSDEDSGSEESCVRDRFLEELEEMSQQSGQDLPFEWELTSTSVTHANSGEGAGAFELDHTGSGSVWEVFDGRCLRHDCQEVRHRYNNLFKWLSRVCSPPTKSTLLGEGSAIIENDDGLEGGQRWEKVGEAVGKGWAAAESGELDSGFVNQLMHGRQESIEGVHSITSKEELGNRVDIYLSEADLLDQLISLETQKINQEQCMRGHLFNQECEKLQQRSDNLQTKCNELESSNHLLLQQLAALDQKCRILESEHVSEVAKEINQVVSSAKKKSDHFSEETALPEKCDFRLSQQLSDSQETVRMQQEENVKLQEKKGTLEEKCRLLQEEVSTLKQDNMMMLEELSVQRKVKDELTAKCNALTEELGSMSNHQEIVHKKDALQALCSSLKEQLSAAQDDRLRSENEILLGNKEILLARDRELNEKCELLEDKENQYKGLEESYNTLQAKCALLQSQFETLRRPGLEATWKPCSLKNTKPPEKGSKGGKNSAVEEDQKNLNRKVESLAEENRFLQEKIDILEESNKSLKDQCDVIQERNELLQHRSQCDESYEFLQAELLFVKENLQAAEEMNNSLLNKVRLHEGIKQMDKSVQEKNKTLHEKCAALAEENKTLATELRFLREEKSTARRDCKLLEDRCHALQAELRETTQSCQSLREQLNEQSIALEHVVNEMRTENSLVDAVAADLDDGQKEQQTTGSESSAQEEQPHQMENGKYLRDQIMELEQTLIEKVDLIDELKEKLTVLSLQQAAIGSPCVHDDILKELKEEAHELREELIEKESIVQDLQEQLMCLKQTCSELKRKVKEDSDLEQEVSILHQALFEKEKVIQELKETSKLLQLSHQDKSQASRRLFSESKMQNQIYEKLEKRILPASQSRCRETEETSERSVESSESIPVSSDPDSDVMSGHNMDIVKEMGRLRKDIRKTKAVYANESALFQEALDREPVSQIKSRSTKSHASTFDISENDIPDDPEQLKKILVKLLEENKSLTTENLRLQLCIREQEALVVEIEEALPKVDNPLEEWQSLFERQLLLLQKQRDELLYQIFERDSGVRLLSSRMGRESVRAVTIHHQQEDLSAKIGELEHCHQLLQQRHAELAHCQTERRHLEQLLLLKDETERQLMRQKRLLEEELINIEGKLQEREAVLAEEKARLMKELKQKELHIFNLQTSQVIHPHLESPSNDPAYSHLRPALMGRPQSASTPCLSTRSRSHVHLPQVPLYLPQDESTCSQPDTGEYDGSVFKTSGHDPPASQQNQPFDLKSYSLSHEELKTEVTTHHAEGCFTGRRHSTGSVRSSHIPVPKDPEEMYKFHREAVERLRNKLRLQMEVEMAQLSEGQASAITGYWQRHNRQMETPASCDKCCSVL